MDMVIGAITGYNFDQIKLWVNSLDRCGFQGDKVLLCYNIKADTIKELTDRGYSLLGFKQESNGDLTYQDKNSCIMLDRFIHMWHFLRDRENKEKYRFIVATDVKDVVFQMDPTLWLEQHLGDKTIAVGSEGIQYKHEPWGVNNLTLSFGEPIYEENKNNLIYNAGTIGGRFSTMVDFFKVIWLTCGRSPQWVPGGGGPDQAALNVLVQSEPYFSTTEFALVAAGWCANLGTIAEPKFAEHLVESPPIIKNDMVCTSTGKPFCLVHQYDRIPEYKALMEKKYAS